MAKPMKPCEAWAMVSQATGEVRHICLDITKKTRAAWMLKRGERLARVRITEVEEPKP